ncbi:MAG: ABC transporter ATP-binding protein [Lachnospiraceae bacterium]|nr:ABC transporter ATP-binding protein [Lachnospiraceae bacterium]
MGEVILDLQDIRKSFGKNEILKGLNLKVEEGEFLTFLGASGCGKTTTLRIIAGLETPDEGQVILNGEDVTKKEPNERDVNTVFQNYALFPHMSVEENIAYGLKLRKVPKDEIRKRVREALALVQLSGYEKRRTTELSGGQKQRVAIARAVVNNPKILLLDEPLGALDAKLRHQMQLELKKLQKSLGITFLYITHDQEEAINMSDRIVVMKEGQFEQIGTPDEIYNEPKTSYVAAFVGDSNILTGTVLECKDDKVKLAFADGIILAAARGKNYPEGKKLIFSVRRENIKLENSKSEYSDLENLELGDLRSENCESENSKPRNHQSESHILGNPEAKPVRAVVKEKSFAGGMLRIVFTLSDQTEIVASRQGINYDLVPGEETTISFKPDHAVILEEEM